MVQPCLTPTILPNFGSLGKFFFRIPAQGEGVFSPKPRKHITCGGRRAASACKESITVRMLGKRAKATALKQTRLCIAFVMRLQVFFCIFFSLSNLAIPFVRLRLEGENSNFRNSLFINVIYIILHLVECTALRMRYTAFELECGKDTQQQL